MLRRSEKQRSTAESGISGHRYIGSSGHRGIGKPTAASSTNTYELRRTKKQQLLWPAAVSNLGLPASKKLSRNHSQMKGPKERGTIYASAREPAQSRAEKRKRHASRHGASA